MYPISPRTAARFAIVPMVVALVLALAGCARATPRPTAAGPSPTFPSPTATASSAPALPPDKDPTKPQYHEAELGDQIGGPTEFATFHMAAWDGTTMRADYSYHCNGDGCTDHVAPLLATWARKAGAPTAEFTTRKLSACLRSACSTTYARDGLTVVLTASVAPDTTFAAQPGDLLYVAGVTIRAT